MTLLVHGLCCMLGFASWVAINAIWVQLPLMVSVLPEGWLLPSYLTLIIQVANVGPLAVALLNRFRPGLLKEVNVIYAILGVGLLSCLLLSVFWNATLTVGGELRSLPLLVLTFFLAIVDCTSSVTFLPFMLRLRAHYLPTYFLGEGLSGLIPSLLALAQGTSQVKCVNSTFWNGTTTEGTIQPSYQMHAVYQEPLFSTSVFFLLLVGMLFGSFFSFTLLDRLPLAHLQYSPEGRIAIAAPSSDSKRPSTVEVQPIGEFDIQETSSMGELTTELGTNSRVSYIGLSTVRYTVALLLVFWANSLTNGVLPSVQAYSSLPYGEMAYHLVAALGAMANPMVCFVPKFFACRSQVILAAMTLIGTAFGCCILAMAALSPCPLLVNTGMGVFLIVLFWVLFTGILTYVKVMVGLVLRQEGRMAMLWCGGVEQVGSAVGAFVMFPLINIYQIFTSGDPCTTVCH
uniref:solute carrier family 52, riboflavin transporter, member 3-B-like n=1 Tax=Myxine glutinosa TaxID=7769 RepID=UPI00358F183A